MPILFVNGKRRGLRIRGRATVSNPARRRARRGPHGTQRLRPTTQEAFIRRLEKDGYMPIAAQDAWRRRQARRRNKKNPARKRRARQPVALARYWAKHRKNPARRRTHPAHQRHAPGARLQWKNGRWVAVKNKRRSKSMAKGSRKRSKAMKRVWAARRRAGKVGALGRTKRRRARRRTGGKRRGRARKVHHKKRTRARRRVRRSRRRTRRTAMTRKIGRRRRARRTSRMHMMLGPEAATVRMNPGRRRRKRRRSHRRGYTVRRRRRRSSHRRSHRRGRRRSYRRYRRNPGIGDIFSELKRVIPVAVSFLANRMVVNKFGPMLPVVSSLGTLQGPVLSVASLLLTNFVTKKVGALSRYREQAMMGAGFQALASLWTAFAPASIQSAVGEYVNMGDYVAVGAAPPLRENFTLSDYVAVGGDGVEEELGMGAMEELGVEEELGNVLMGGLPGPVSGSMGMLKQVPAQQFIAQIPARSFTKQIPAVTTGYDASSDLYSGIFGGKFGGGG